MPQLCSSNYLVLGFARLPHHNKTRPDNSRVLKWRARGVSSNYVHIPIVTYSIRVPPQTIPDQLQSHKNQSPCAGRRQSIVRTATICRREAAKCIRVTSYQQQHFSSTMLTRMYRGMMTRLYRGIMTYSQCAYDYSLSLAPCW